MYNYASVTRDGVKMPKSMAPLMSLKKSAFCIISAWRSAVAEWLRRRGASLGVPGSIPGAGNSYALQALEQGC